MKDLEWYLLAQFSFHFLHLDGRSLFPCFPEGTAWQWSSDQEPLCSCVGNTLFHQCGFLFIYLLVVFLLVFFLLLEHGRWVGILVGDPGFPGFRDQLPCRYLYIASTLLSGIDL